MIHTDFLQSSTAIAFFLFLCSQLLQPAVAQQIDVVPVAPETLGTTEVSEFLATLTDRQARAVLNRELMDRARRQSAESEDTAHGGLGVALVQFRLFASSFGVNLGGKAETLVQGVQSLPSVLPGALVKVSGSAGVMIMPDLLGAFAIGLLVYMLARWFLAPAFRWLMDVSEVPVFARPVRGIARAAVALVPVLAFTLASFIYVLLRYPHAGAAREFLVTYLSAAVLLLLINIALRLLIAPAAPSLRLVPLDDRSARWVFNGVMLVSVVVLVLWLTAGLLILTGMPLASHLAIVVITGGIIALISATVIVLAGRRIQHASRGGDAGFKLVSFWPWVASLFVLMVYANWAWHMMSRTSTGVWAGIASILVVLIIPVLDPAWCRFSRNLLARPETPDSTHGSEEITSEAREEWRVRNEQHHYYRGIIRNTGLTILYLFCAVLILELCGVSVLRTVFGENSRELAGAALVKVLFTAALTWVAWRSIAAMIDPRMPDGKKSLIDADEADLIPQTRIETLMPLFRFAARFVVILISALVMLSSLGINIGPLLAGAGVLGLAIGFGAQTLVRDIVSGVFFLLDDAFRIGEYIEFENLRGEVESISLRSLKLRHHKGAIHTIPYGELRSITNHNRDWSIYKMEFRLHIDTDIEKTRKLIKKLGQELLQDPEYGPKFIQPMKSQGINRVEDTALFLRVKFMCKPREQYVLRRVAYVRLTRLFKENGIELAPKAVRVLGSGSTSTDDSQVVSAAASTIDSATGGAA